MIKIKFYTQMDLIMIIVYSLFNLNPFLHVRNHGNPWNQH